MLGILYLKLSGLDVGGRPTPNIIKATQRYTVKVFSMIIIINMTKHIIYQDACEIKSILVIFCSFHNIKKKGISISN